MTKKQKNVAVITKFIAICGNALSKLSELENEDVTLGSEDLIKSVENSLQSTINKAALLLSAYDENDV